MNRTCKKCYKEKLIEEFAKNGIRYRYTCKDCYKIYHQEYDNKNKEKHSLYHREYRKVNDIELKKNKKEYSNRPETKKKRLDKYRTIEERFKRWKQSAKQRNLEFVITLEYLKSFPMICYHSGLELTFEPNQINTVSLDRIDSNKGYFPDNICLCCSYINLMKLDMQNREFYDMCRKIIIHQSNKLAN